MTVQKRIHIATDAIGAIRRDERNWPKPKYKYPLTYGCYGLLDYIKTGKPEKIIDSIIRNAVEKIIALQSSSRMEGQS